MSADTPDTVWVALHVDKDDAGHGEFIEITDSREHAMRLCEAEAETRGETLKPWETMREFRVVKRPGGADVYWSARVVSDGFEWYEVTAHPFRRSVS